MYVGALALAAATLCNTCGNFTPPGKQEGRTNGRERLASVCFTSLQTRTRDQEAPPRHRHQLGPRKAAQNCASTSTSGRTGDKVKGLKTFGSRSGALPILPQVFSGSRVGAHLDHVVQGGPWNVAGLVDHYRGCRLGLRTHNTSRNT